MCLANHATLKRLSSYDALAIAYSFNNEVEREKLAVTVAYLLLLLLQ